MDVYSTEEEQIAAIKKYVEENGFKILLTLVITIGGYFGFITWKNDVQTKKEEASVIYSEVTQLLQSPELASENKVAFDTALARLQEKYPKSIYKHYAELFNAKISVDNGDLDSAATSLKAVIDAKFTDELVELATLRLAEVEFSRGNNDEALKLLSYKPNALISKYEELKGDIYFDKGNKADALASYKKAEAALDGSATYSSRVLAMKVATLDTGNSSKIFPIEGAQKEESEKE